MFFFLICFAFFIRAFQATTSVAVAVRRSFIWLENVHFFNIIISADIYTWYLLLMLLFFFLLCYTINGAHHWPKGIYKSLVKSYRKYFVKNHKFYAPMIPHIVTAVNCKYVRWREYSKYEGFLSTSSSWIEITF